MATLRSLADPWRSSFRTLRGELCDRLAELPRDRRIVVYCQKGQRGYLAACPLKGSGFEDVAIRGGFAQAKLNGFESYPATVPANEASLNHVA
jgi:rhodanese-related sulfurtransferase